jgi:uncharacterized protein (DUF1330 family)
MQDSRYDGVMPGYVIAHVQHIHDPERYAEYAAQTPASIAAHGGRFLVRGGETDPVEFEPPIGKIVLIEFPTFEAAQGWYHSDEYRRLTAIRQSAADAFMLLVDGYEPPPDG